MYVPVVSELYNHFYRDPANRQKEAIDKAQQQSFAEAERNRQFQLGGLDRALTFYGPARNVLAEMLGGSPAGGFGQTTLPPGGGPGATSPLGSPAATPPGPAKPIDWKGNTAPIPPASPEMKVALSSAMHLNSGPWTGHAASNFYGR